MSKLGTLIKLNFKALLSALKFGRSKGSRFTGIGAIALLAFLSIYISGVYSFMFGELLKTANLLDYLIPLMGILGFVLTIVMTVSSASGFVFSNRDSDLMLSLPVSAFSVMLSKILSLYLECLIFCALFVLPSGIAYIYYGGAWDAGLIIRLVIAAVVLPLMSTLFCVVFGWLLSWITAHAKHKSIVSTAVMAIFMVAVFYLSLRLNSLSQLLIANSDAFGHALQTWLYPFGLLQSGVLCSWLDIILLCVICIVPFLLVVWLFSTRYKQILSGLASHDVRNDYKLEKVKTAGLFSSLFKKECRRFFGTTIYLFNTGIGSILLLGGSIYLCFAGDKATAMLGQLGGIDNALSLIILVAGFCLSLTNTTCVSISLEGKTLWILKEAPIPAATVFRAKAAVNLLITWPVIIIAMMLTTISMGISPLPAAAATLAMLAFSLEHSLFGLLINLHYPKMDCDNDTIIVKQSASAFFGYFGGMLPLAFFALIYVLFAAKLLSLELYLFIVAIALAAVAAFFWHRLKTWGAQRLIEL